MKSLEEEMDKRGGQKCQASGQKLKKKAGGREENEFISIFGGV